MATPITYLPLKVKDQTGLFQRLQVLQEGKKKGKHQKRARTKWEPLPQLVTALKTVVEAGINENNRSEGGLDEDLRDLEQLAA
jgi:hypothetical protein